MDETNKMYEEGLKYEIEKLKCELVFLYRTISIIDYFLKNFPNHIIINNSFLTKLTDNLKEIELKYGRKF